MRHSDKKPYRSEEHVLRRQIARPRPSLSPTISNFLRKQWQLSCLACRYQLKYRRSTSANICQWIDVQFVKMGPRTSTLLLVFANVLIPIAILIFASGFFPYKPFLSGLAQYEINEYGPPPEAPFDKVVFMVVDALRRYCSLQSLSGQS